MNVKSIFGTIGETLTGITAILGSVVSVGIMSQIVFGTGSVSYTHLTLPTSDLE